MAFSTIDKSTSFFNTVLWTGTNSGETISGVGFQPDLNWTKQRTGTEPNVLVDSVRGVEKTIYSDANTAEATLSTGLTAFNSDGFVHGILNAYCEAANTFASWSWKAGTTSGLTGGTITPSAYSFNTTSGFSILAYTGNGVAGATIPHGLGAVPNMIICKKLNNVAQYTTYTSALGATKYMVLNTTTDVNDEDWAWNDTEPTSSVFSVGDNISVNENTSSYVAYCWTDISGYSKFSSYLGNGNVDGPFVFTGFKPAWVVVKNTSSAENWLTVDDKINPFNPMDTSLFPNTTSAEGTDAAYTIDMVSNGFKVRTTDSTFNTSGSTYIYMAFGQPIVSNSGVCANAR